MDAKRISDLLREPFPLAKLGFKPQTVKDNRALAVPYIDARDVMDRLDTVVGVEGWSDDYTPLAGGQWLCRLSVRIDGQWVMKCDVGAESDQPDKGDKCKSAVSDALKRAAVKFGVGRYLYSIPNIWHEYDAVKKRFVTTPPVPASFLPQPDRGSSKATSPPAPAPPPKPADPPPFRTYQEYGALLQTAKAQATLGSIWEDVTLAFNSNWLTKEQYTDLARVKDARKAWLAAPKQ